MAQDARREDRDRCEADAACKVLLDRNSPRLSARNCAALIRPRVPATGNGVVPMDEGSDGTERDTSRLRNLARVRLSARWTRLRGFRGPCSDLRPLGRRRGRSARRLRDPDSRHRARHGLLGRSRSHAVVSHRQPRSGVRVRSRRLRSVRRAPGLHARRGSLRLRVDACLQHLSVRQCVRKQGATPAEACE